ncbi:MAG: hypothetical protein ACPIOQ_21720 [Promethearchaeia archaeon]
MQGDTQTPVSRHIRACDAFCWLWARSRVLWAACSAAGRWMLYLSRLASNPRDGMRHYGDEDDFAEGAVWCMVDVRAGSAAYR